MKTVKSERSTTTAASIEDSPESLCWNQLLEIQADGVALVDTTGVIRYASDRLASMVGIESSHLVGTAVQELLPSHLREAHVFRRAEFRHNAVGRRMGDGADLSILRANDSEFAVAVDLFPIRVGAKNWSALLFRDDTVLRAIEQLRLDDQIRFRLAFEDNMAPMLFTDLEDRAIAVNDSFCQMIGFTRDEILNRDSTSFTHPGDLGISKNSHIDVTSKQVEQSRYVKRYVRKDGRVIVVEALRVPARNEAGDILYFVISERDVTERTQRNRLLHLLNSVNRLATFATDEATFLQELCDAVVTEGGYSLAWLAIESNDAHGGVDIMCASGNTAYLEGPMVDWLGSENSAGGPTTIALRTGQSQVVNDLVHQWEFKIWRQRATEFGFGSMVAIPDRIGVRRAALIIYHDDLFAFDHITVKGLEEIVREGELAVIQLRTNQMITDALDEAIQVNSDLRKTQDDLGESEQRFRLSFETNMAPMIFSDHDDLAIAVNDAFCEMVGFTREEILGHDSEMFTLPADVGISEREHRRFLAAEIDQARYVKRYLRKNQRVVIAEVSRSSTRDERGRILYFFSSERDITEERTLTAQLSHRALHDPLTGLANRALFEDRLTHARAKITRDGGWGAVVMINLDNFKGVNDARHHAGGDELIVEVARRLESTTRSTDTLCHLGGDEFLYLAEGLKSTTEAEGVATRLLGVLATPFRFDDTNLEQNASMGVAAWNATSPDVSDLIQNADAALREAKSLNRGGFTLFEPRMHERAVRGFTLAQELRQALAEGQISMHYQPIVDLTSSYIVGFEALMRWHHPHGGVIAPDVFIPLAEQSHLIIELGAFALREGIAAASSWRAAGPTRDLPFVTVNLSAHQFYQPGLVALIEECLETSHLAPERLILEITESAALQNVPVALELINDLRAVGITIALDDFGTGYSSLSYITMLQPRIIKIDKSFVSPAEPSEQNDLLLEMIVAMGPKLAITVLAEGIETSSQLERLRSLHCELGQGYLFSRAVPSIHIGEMIQRSFDGHFGPTLLEDQGTQRPEK
jgi:diguanylate cyclase (GGDEF)-like protein/PAS domain S-box-containing protein